MTIDHRAATAGRSAKGAIMERLLVTIAFCLLCSVTYGQHTSPRPDTDAPRWSRREVIRRSLGDEAADRQLPSSRDQWTRESLRRLEQIQRHVDEYSASLASVQFNWSPTAPHQLAEVRVIAGNRLGTGTYVQQDGVKFVLTCKHVCEGSADGRCKVEFHNGKSAIGEWTMDKFGYDIAAIRVDEPGVTPLRIADAKPAASSRIEILGYAHSDNLTLRHWYGTLSSTSNGTGYYGAGVAHGDSGGGVLNDRHELVGLVAWGDPQVADSNGKHETYHRSGGPFWTPVRSFASRLAAKWSCRPGGS